MKVCITLPKSATAYASMMLADSMEQEKIDAAVKKCEEDPVEIDLAEMGKSDMIDNSDLQAINMVLALLAIGKVIGEL